MALLPQLNLPGKYKFYNNKLIRIQTSCQKDMHMQLPGISSLTLNMHAAVHQYIQKGAGQTNLQF